MIGFSLLYSADTVVDSDTNLQWQDNTEVKYYKWDQAKNYCLDLSLGGYTDWRLPNVQELISIVDIQRSNPAIKKGFENVKSADYWTSSGYAADSSKVWEVTFKDGRVFMYDSSSSGYVRCIRGRQ